MAVNGEEGVDESFGSSDSDRRRLLWVLALSMSMLLVLIDLKSIERMPHGFIDGENKC